MVKSTLISFAIMTATFLFIDVIWLSQAVGYFYQPNIGALLRETPLALPAILFYLIYPLGVTILVIVPSLEQVLLKKIFYLDQDLNLLESKAIKKNIKRIKSMELPLILINSILKFYQS